MLKKAMSVFLIFAVITQMSFPASAIIPGEDSYVAEGHLIDDPAFLASAEVVEMDDSIKLSRVSNNGVVGNRTQYRSDVVQIFTENEENKDTLMTQLTMRPLGSQDSDLVFDNMATVSIQFTLYYEVEENGVIDDVNLLSACGYVDVHSNQVECVSHFIDVLVKEGLYPEEDYGYMYYLDETEFEYWEQSYYGDNITVTNFPGSIFWATYTVTVQRGQSSEWEVSAENLIRMPV